MRSKICLFTYMIGGWGDLMACKEVAKILRRHFPHLNVQSVVCIPHHLAPANCDLDEATIPIFCGQECPFSMLSQEALQALLSADLILSIPTFYPHSEELKSWLFEQSKGKPPKFLCIGQYGFIESQWFHRQSGNLCMGLNPLEKGILTREPIEKAEFISLENKTLLHSLFGTSTPSNSEVEHYLDSHRFHLSYLYTLLGGAIYLHALLQSVAHQNQTIDICTPHIGWLIAYIQTRKEANRPFLEGDFGVGTVEIHFEGRIDTVVLKASGKTVRFICPNSLSNADFRKLLHLSEEFIAVRGDQSFSEVICANRLFFYDTAPWSRYFIRDLVDLASVKLEQNSTALSLFQCMKEAALYHEVEETIFQEKRPWIQIAQEIGLSLQQPDALAGFRKLNQIIQTEHSFNNSLCQLVERELHLIPNIRNNL